MLLASYALGQLFGAPAAGRLSDRYGRKPLLLLSIGGTFASLLLLGFARSLWMLFLSRFLDGITGGNITVAQAYITDSSTEENRAKSLGMIGAAFSLGFIFGPIIGGVLSAWGYAVPSFATAGVSAINLLLITFLLPESLDPEKRKILAQSPRTAFSEAPLEGAAQTRRRTDLSRALHVRHRVRRFHIDLLAVRPVPSGHSRRTPSYS